MVRAGGALVLGVSVRNAIGGALHCVGGSRIAKVDARIASAGPLVVTDSALVRPVRGTEGDGSGRDRGGQCPNPIWQPRVGHGQRPRLRSSRA